MPDVSGIMHSCIVLDKVDWRESFCPFPRASLPGMHAAQVKFSAVAVLHELGGKLRGMQSLYRERKSQRGAVRERTGEY